MGAPNSILSLTSLLALCGAASGLDTYTIQRDAKAALQEGREVASVLEEFVTPLVSALHKALDDDRYAYGVAVEVILEEALAGADRARLEAACAWYEKLSAGERRDGTASSLVPVLVEQHLKVRLAEATASGDPGELRLPTLDADRRKRTLDRLPDGVDPALALRFAALEQAADTPPFGEVGEDEIVSYLSDREMFYERLYAATISADPDAARQVAKFRWVSFSGTGSEFFYELHSIGRADAALTRKDPAAVLGNLMAYGFLDSSNLDLFWAYAEACGADPELLALGQLTQGHSFFANPVLPVRERGGVRSMQILAKLLHNLARTEQETFASGDLRSGAAQALADLVDLVPQEVAVPEATLAAAYDALAATAHTARDSQVVLRCLRPFADSGNDGHRQIVREFLDSPHPKIVRGVVELLNIPPGKVTLPEEKLRFQVLLDGQPWAGEGVAVDQQVRSDDGTSLQRKDTITDAQGFAEVDRADQMFLNEDRAWVVVSPEIDAGGGGPPAACWFVETPLRALARAGKIEIRTFPATVQIDLPAGLPPGEDGAGGKLRANFRLDPTSGGQREEGDIHRHIRGQHFSLEFAGWGEHPLPRLPAGKHHVDLYAPGYLPWEGEFAVGPARDRPQLTVEPAPAYAARVRARLAGGGALDSIGVSVERLPDTGEAEGGDDWSYRTELTLEDGGTLLKNLPVGKFRLKVTPSREFAASWPSGHKTLDQTESRPHHAGAQLEFEVSADSPLVQDLPELVLEPAPEDSPGPTSPPNPR